VTRSRIAAGVAVLACASLAQSSVRPPANRRNFVTCPIVRDTKTVPCWLAVDRGETYYLGIQQDISADFHPPQLNHRVLVEGVSAGGERICGGLPLTSLHVSVLPEIDRACSTVLPAEPGIDAPPAPRGPGPAATHAGPRVYAGPATDGPLVTIPFDFDSDYLPLGHTTALERLAARVRQMTGARLEVTGHRAATLLSTGERLVETAGLARRRADKIGGMLRELVPAATVTVRAMETLEPASGVDDADRRRVVIRISSR